MRKRNRHVNVWMNEQEYRHLKKQAGLAGLGIDPFIHSLVSGVKLRPHPPDTYAALLLELSAIGNNMNQIAYWANAIPHKGHWKSGDSGRRRISTAGVALGEGYAVTVRPQ